MKRYMAVHWPLHTCAEPLQSILGCTSDGSFTKIVNMCVWYLHGYNRDHLIKSTTWRGEILQRIKKSRKYLLLGLSEGKCVMTKRAKIDDKQAKTIDRNVTKKLCSNRKIPGQKLLFSCLTCFFLSLLFPTRAVLSKVAYKRKYLHSRRN